MPDHYPQFPSAEQILDYLKDYARHFQLTRYIQYNTEVVRADPILDGSTWNVFFKDGSVKVYKGVIVCTGHDWDKNIPTYPGEPTLEIIHTRDVRFYKVHL